ncbi:MAG TPA: ABC transporter substrate-binding protein, partial [Candidatus Methylomirabilis sp.]|nr:ABC transporter substrate-binding protein [Candidatus Methylomirabilis sp.]
MTSSTMHRAQAIGIRSVILLLLFLSVYGRADGQQSQAGPKSGGTLSISHGVDPNHLDPAAINATQGTTITQLVAQPLTSYVNSTGQLEPLLATSWTSSPDLRSWTFTLRPGIKFTDGTPFNADAVKKNYDRLLDPRINPPALNDVRYIKSTEVLDDLHVRLQLSQPIAFLPSIVSTTTAAITSPASWTASGNTYQLAERIVGTGPYKLVEYVKGDHVLVARNDEYWGSKPYYANQVFRVMPDAASREAALRSGQLDVLSLPPAPDLDSLRNDPTLRVIQAFGRTVWIGINTQSRSQPLLTNPVVRQALNYAVDKDALVKNVLFGAATVLDSPAPQIAFGYCKTGPYSYDPQKAKQLLQQAGAANMSVTLTSPSGRYL